MKKSECLKKLIDAFKEDKNCSGVEDGYRGLAFDEVKKHVSKAEFKSKKGDWKKHSHQNRISQESLEGVGREFAKVKSSDWKGKDFDSLYNFVKDCIEKVVGIGPLMVYDTTLRFAAFYGVKPKKVYLHAGAWEGAKYLVEAGLMARPKSRVVPLSEFPEELQKLSAKNVEIFLCVKKDELKKLKKIK